MKYENELVKLLPEFKNYLKKLAWKLTGYIENEEIFSRAVEIVCIAIEKNPKIKNPEQYMKGVFWRAVQNIQGGIVKENKKMRSYEEHIQSEQADEGHEYPIISRLDDYAEGPTEDVWNLLKRHKGEMKLVINDSKTNRRTVFYHKKKLKNEYKKLKRALH